MTDTGVRWEWLWYVWVHVGAPERALGAPGSITEPTRKSQTNSESCLGSYGYSFRGLQAVSETLQMYMRNRLPSTANVMDGWLLIITSQSYLPSSSSTLYFVPRYVKEMKERGDRFKHKPRYTETITQLSNRKISIKDGVDVIHSISYLIRANECRNTQFIKGAMKLEVLLELADYSFLVSGWIGIPMLFGSICDI